MSIMVLLQAVQHQAHCSDLLHLPFVCGEEGSPTWRHYNIATAFLPRESPLKMLGFQFRKLIASFTGKMPRLQILGKSNGRKGDGPHLSPIVWCHSRFMSWGPPVVDGRSFCEECVTPPMQSTSALACILPTLKHTLRGTRSTELRKIQIQSKACDFSGGQQVLLRVSGTIRSCSPVLISAQTVKLRPSVFP